MTDTPNLTLPLMAAGQAQKHVMHNEALAMLDGLVQLSAIDRRTAPPAAPAVGARYLIDSAATGIFLGHERHIASFELGGWRYFTPRAGWQLWLQSIDSTLVFDGTDWRDLPLHRTDMLGINTTADTTNRLAVSSPSLLLTHSGSDARLNINKASTAATASMIFQSSWSGHAEMGLAGDNHFGIKVSADGTEWRSAVQVDGVTGRARFPNGMDHAATMKPNLGLILTPGGDGQVSLFRNDAVRSAHPRQATIASIAGDVITLTTNSAAMFYHAFMQGVSYLRMWNVSKATAVPCWIKSAPAVNTLQVVSASSLAGWLAGEVIQFGEPSFAAPTRSFVLDISPMLQTVLGAVFPQTGLVLKMTAGGVGVRTAVLASATAASGSFIGVNALSNGGLNSGIAIVACSVPSPISNSNLLFLREDDGGANTLSTTLASCIAVLG